MSGVSRAQLYASAPPGGTDAGVSSMGLAARSSLKLRRGLTLSVGVPAAEPVETSAASADADDKEQLGQKYDIFEVLGQGSSAVVRRGARKIDGLKVALKKVVVPDKEKLDMVKREYDTLNKIRHPHIVRALDFFVAVERAIIVMEFVEGKDLNLTLRDLPGKRFDERTCQVLFKQLLEAVAHLHEKRILHRDIKGPNLIISPDHKNVKLLDFNAACRLADGGSLTMTGTHEYCAPEVLLGQSPSDVGDVWSAGLCLHLMMAGRLPRKVEQYSSLDKFAEAVSSRPVKLHGKQYWEAISENGRTVLRRCLTIDMYNRPPALMLLLQEPWLQGGSKSDRGRSRDRRTSQASRSTTCDESFSSDSGVEGKDEGPFVARVSTMPLSESILSSIVCSDNLEDEDPESPTPVNHAFRKLKSFA